jgi:Family of unknown function (DUF5519)
MRCANHYLDVMRATTPDVLAEVASWPGVELGQGRFGSTRFLVGRRELGHLHGSSTLDLPLPKALKAELIGRGDAEQHRFTPPGSGWVTLRLRDEESRRRALEILRERYEHALALRARAERAPSRTA